jgi:hypothetical protein
VGGGLSIFFHFFSGQDSLRSRFTLHARGRATAAGGSQAGRSRRPAPSWRTRTRTTERAAAPGDAFLLHRPQVVVAASAAAATAGSRRAASPSRCAAVCLLQQLIQSCARRPIGTISATGTLSDTMICGRLKNAGELLSCSLITPFLVNVNK